MEQAGECAVSMVQTCQKVFTESSAWSSSLPETEKYGLSISRIFCPLYLFPLETFKFQVRWEACLPFDNGLLKLHKSANSTVISSTNVRIGECVTVRIM